MMSVPRLFFFFVLISIFSYSEALKCHQCKSTTMNKKLMKEFDLICEHATNTTSKVCEADNDDGCSVGFYRFRNDVVSWVRGCCGKFDSPCLDGIPDADQTWGTKSWHVSCRTDNCNTMDPRSYQTKTTRGSGNTLDNMLETYVLLVILSIMT
eukprot:TRINITY_DN25727_c0_g1_i1.p1 TRINITY_DN25727_c0_g1~~TRINITY_DN25727_c0_g1_i1.p1  ORF type:complete len:153 (+),score=11.08 TRINITY_DN25727_c0_g1_i1:43-501(+)